MEMKKRKMAKKAQEKEADLDEVASFLSDRTGNKEEADSAHNKVPFLVSPDDSITLLSVACNVVRFILSLSSDSSSSEKATSEIKESTARFIPITLNQPFKASLDALPANAELLSAAAAGDALLSASSSDGAALAHVAECLAND